ncbi:MAG: carboxypeptidase-like regulatory domain-containing protein, partial [Bacteroidales bacterium]|nr:carboxypeptidase-like regulatory domain-containing protein [Bacteroidales bacterium]
MKNFTFKSIGKLLMLAVFSLFSVYATNAQCTYQIELTDPGYGDGWNGGRVTVFVNGTAVLTDITLAGGYGPEYHDFSAATGDEITTDYTGGGWSYENNYKILDPGGNIQFETGYPNGTPSDLVSPGVTANCPVSGDILVTVTDAGGNPMQGVEVGVIDVNTLYTDAAGEALFSGVEVGIHTVYAFQPGVNYIEQEAEVFLGQTTNVDFVMAPPVMVINPLAIVETLNPNEWFTTYIGIQNIGDGDLFWTAEVV